ncbi:uncharacterized protein BDV14DRAFT_198715 [Aspergillus stella-maris]|uniref:uncharacterized protein n=1 Tax=Aspergillus stella-maris TaxID=1810926 RepID=UPI003CCDC5C7
MAFPDLPPELIGLILADLSNFDLARLMAVTHELFLIFGPFLCDRDNGFNDAMFWACRSGLTRLIRRLVQYYAVDVSGIHLQWKPREGFPDRAYIPTLYIAAARGQVDAFRLLLKLGARVDIPGVPKGMTEKFVKRICSPVGNWALLRLFYKTGLDEQLRSRHHPSLTLPLFWVIHNSSRLSEPPLDIVKMLLSRGAGEFINEGRRSHRQHFLTPLTVAMRQNNYDATPLLDLLLQEGAKIHGPKITASTSKPTHIPIFAAVEAMAATGDTKYLDWCLRRGANVNHCAGWQGRVAWYYSDFGVNPAVFYVLSIDYSDKKTWNHASAETTGIKRKSKVLTSPVEGLSYLVERRAHFDIDRDWKSRLRNEVGSDSTTTMPLASKVNNGLAALEMQFALLPFSQTLPRTNAAGASSGRADSTNTKPPITTDNKALWCVDRYIQRWGLTKLRNNPHYHEIAKYLVRNCAESGKADILIMYECERAFLTKYGSYLEEAVQYWLHFLDNVLLPSLPTSATNLLVKYILRRNHHHSKGLGEFQKATIDHLIFAGADVNASWIRTGDDVESESTPLHELCCSYNSIERETQHYSRLKAAHAAAGSALPGKLPPLPPLPRISMPAESKGEILRYIIGKGADASRVVKGRKARDVLVEDVDLGLCSREFLDMVDLLS